MKIEIYRITKLDMMGYQFDELFFRSLEKARSEYAKLLMEYRNKENTVKRGDENHLSSPIEKGNPIKDPIIKKHMIEVWYKTGYESDEWDTSVEHLQLEKIEVV